MPVQLATREVGIHLQAIVNCVANSKGEHRDLWQEGASAEAEHASAIGGGALWENAKTAALLRTIRKEALHGVAGSFVLGPPIWVDKDEVEMFPDAARHGEVSVLFPRHEGRAVNVHDPHDLRNSNVVGHDHASLLRHLCFLSARRDPHEAEKKEQRAADELHETTNATSRPQLRGHEERRHEDGGERQDCGEAQQEQWHAREDSEQVSEAS
mmetsp:Transcript_58741/g.129057  ORF Transcript_58741/g.129057 Transcript_58741/m.129057 type:complete len:212 (-) Transcript_58741:178-813(-)